MVGVGHVWGAAGLLGVVMVGCVILLWHLVKRRLDQEDRDRSRILEEEAGNRKLFREFLAGKDSAVHQHELDSRLKLFEADLKLANENALQTKIENLRADLQRDHASHEALLRVAAETRLHMVQDGIKALGEFEAALWDLMKATTRKFAGAPLGFEETQNLLTQILPRASALPPSLVADGMTVARSYMTGLLDVPILTPGDNEKDLKTKSNRANEQGRKNKELHDKFSERALAWRTEEWDRLPIPGKELVTVEPKVGEP